MTAAKIYDVWRLMLRRCLDPRLQHYAYYGGRGISVCPSWQEFEPFRDWALENGYVEGLQLDREDPQGDYTPENCRFVTRSENMRNTRRAISVTAFGKTQPLAAWAEEYGVPYRRLHTRIKRGWDPEVALSASAFKGPNRSLEGAEMVRTFNARKFNEERGIA